jgi:hypothetical protein
MPYLWNEFLNLPFDDDSGAVEYDEKFFDDIEIFDADPLILSHIIIWFTDFKILMKEISGPQLSDKVHEKIDKAYGKIEKELNTLLSNDDLPEINKQIIERDLQKIQHTRSIYACSLQDRFRYKSIRQMLTYQAYLLFEYLKRVRLSKFKYPEDYTFECTDMEIYKTISEMFQRIYPYDFLYTEMWDVYKVKELVDNAKRLENPRLRKLKKTIEIFSKTIKPQV